MTVKEIIRALGGPTQVGRRLGLQPQAVSLWTSTGRIPADRVPALEALARELDVDIRAEQMRPDIPWSALRTPA
jgi:DNA-binding transcriptional regulator YdaS (Cro superfamily)